MAHEGVAGIWFAFGLGIAILVFRNVFLPAMVAALRQDIFELRRELFLLMAHGEIECTHPAYTRVRALLNGLLRFAERVTFMDFIVVYFAWFKAGRPREGYDTVQAAIMASAPSEKLLRIQNRVGQLVIKHAIFTSPVAWAALGIIIVAVAVLWIARGGPFDGIARRISARGEIIAEELVRDGHCAA